MTLPANFQAEIDAVDNTWSLASDYDETYDQDQWSYSASGNTYTIVGGSDQAIECGASELLHDLGFRFFGPAGYHEHYIYRPEAITGGLSKAKTKFRMSDLSIWLAYGHSFVDDTEARTVLADAHSSWQTLNAAGMQARWPHGHRWGNIVGQNISFLQSHTSMIIGGDPTVDAPYFNLDLMDTDPTEYNLMVEMCASTLLTAGLTAHNRTHFDPTDGDSQSSDKVFRFAVDVCKRMRAGTNDVAGRTATAGVPDCQIGVLAYGGHRYPASFDVKPYVYVQVAHGFNATDLGYDGLVQAWGQKASSVGIRAYWGVMHWTWSRFGVGIQNESYWGIYNNFLNSGAVSFNSEFNSNWLVNVVPVYALIRFMRTGTMNMSAAVNEVCDKLMPGDDKAKELFTLWSTDGFNKYTMRRSALIIKQMQVGWWKDRLQELLVILDEHRKLPSQASETFDTAFSSLMSKIHGVRRYDTTHSYAWQRRLANGAVSSSKPHLWMYRTDLAEYDTPPDWMTGATTPSQSDFNAVVGSLAEDAYRPPYLFGDDLVITQVTPYNNQTRAVMNVCQQEGTADYIYFGPGYFHTSATDGSDEEIEYYEAGRHIITVAGSKVVHWNGGIAFPVCFYGVRFDGPLASSVDHWPTAVTGHMWMYFHQNVVGETLDISSSARLQVLHAGGTCSVSAGGDPATIQAGQNKIHFDGTGNNTRGTHYIGNANPYWSPDSHLALMPRAMVEKLKPNRVAIAVAT